MEKNKPWDQLAKYFAGELSEKEIKEMESWIKANPHREKEINRLHEIWRETENLPYELHVGEAWMKLLGDIEELESSKTEFTSKVSSPGTFQTHQGSDNINRTGTAWRRAILVAATVLIVALAGFFSFYTDMQQKIAETNEIGSRVFVTKNGERAVYILNDGSRVVLHAGSRLEIPDDYNKNHRELFLEGEAFFEVSHHEERPFIVQSRHAYTRVLGTRFLVQAWPDSGARVGVVVSEGKVAFGEIRSNTSDTDDEVLVTENRMGMIVEGQKPVVTEVTDLNWYLGWTEGRLEFKDRPLREVLPRLERWYNIEIRVQDEKIYQQKVTAKIDYSQSMSEVLRGIAMTLELEVQRNDRTFTFQSPE